MRPVSRFAFYLLCLGLLTPFFGPQAVGDAADPGQYMFTFNTSLPAGGVSPEARLHFCVQDSHNSYCVSVSARRAAIQKIEKGRMQELTSAQINLGPGNVKVEIERKQSEIVVAADGRFLCRARDGAFFGEAAAAQGVNGATAKLERVQPLGEVFFTDDFMRTEAAGDWQPLSGHWEIYGVQWAERSVNPFSLFCRFPDTPQFTDLNKGRTRRYVGIGVRIEYKHDRATIIYVFDGAPAWNAGVRAGDTILVIDGRSAIGTSRGDVVQRLEGNEGQSVLITVARERDKKTTEPTFTVERKRIDLDSIEEAVTIQPAEFSRQTLITAGHHFWSDYTVEASVRSLGRGEIGLASYVKDEKDYLLFRWSADKSSFDRGAMSLVKVVDGTAQTLATKPGGFAPDQFYRLKLAIEGTSVRAYVDGNPVLHADAPDVTWGRAALYAADSLGVYFDDVRIVSSQEDGPRPRIARYKPLFVNDEYMTDWAGQENDWETELDKDGLISCWHRYPFPGDVRFEVQDERAPELILIINADRPISTRGYRLHVNRAGKWFSAYRNAMPLAKNVPLSAEPKRLAIESMDGHLSVAINGETIQRFDTEPVQGGYVGLMGLYKPSPSRVSLSASNVLDYSFDEAPVDWKIVGGRWGIMNRWVCDPRWSWFGGRSRAIASIWHKCSFEGDVTLDVHAALAMPSYWKSPHERPGDLCISICGDGRSPASGYSVIFAGGDNRWTRLYRRQTVVDETTSPLFLFPRREVSWDAAMRLHKRWHHLRLTKRGSYVTFHCDGKLALEFLDPDPLDEGHVGIWTVNNTILLSRARIAFARATPPELVTNDRWPFKDGTFTNATEEGVTANVALGGMKEPAYDVTNALPGGCFALASVADAIDVEKDRMVTFDCKIDPEAKIDFYFDLAPPGTGRHRIRLTGPESDDGKSILLGAFPDAAGDGQRHTASFRLYDVLKDLYPYEKSLNICKIAFANHSNEGYLLAGYGGNPVGAQYSIRNLRFDDRARDDKAPPRVAKIVMPLQDAARRNSVAFHLTDDKSGIDESALQLTVNGKTFNSRDEAVDFERTSGRLELNLPLAGIVLREGDRLDVLLSGLRDLAGNMAKEPCKANLVFRISEDKFAPSNIRIHSGIEDAVHYDFETDLGDCYPVGAQFRTMPGGSGGWLRRERSADAGRGWVLRVQNLRMAHDFGVGFLTRPCDAARFPVLSFDYRIAPDVPIDASFEVDGERKVIRFAANAFRQELRLYGNFETVGAIPRVVADSEWHNASVNLFGVLSSYDPTRMEFHMQDIHFGDDVTGYLGNYEGARFCLDNIRLHPLLSLRTLKPTWTAEDISGVTDHRIAVNAEYDFVPSGKTLTADLEKLKDGFAYIHLMLKDGAGNWSEPIHERIFLDVTPPRAVRFEPQKDMAGTFTIRFREKGGLDPKSITVAVAGKEYKVDNKTMWYDQSTKTLTWRIGSKAREVLASRPSVDVELLTARDFAGNDLPSPMKWSWPIKPAGRQ